MSAGDEKPVEAVTAPDRNDIVPMSELRAAQELVPDDERTAVDGKGPILSDCHCPLLVDESSKIKSTVYEEHINATGEVTGRTYHKLPEQILETPVKCGDCGVWLERYMLPIGADGKPRCAMAVMKALEGVDVGEYLGKAGGIVSAIANAKHPEPVAIPALKPGETETVV